MPDALPTFDAANEAMKAGDVAKAADLWAAVIAAAPDFDGAYRERCILEVARNRRQQGIGWCRQAVGIRESPENLAVLSLALIGTFDGQTASPTETQQGFELAERAVEMDPRSLPALVALCEVGLVSSRYWVFDECAPRLLERQPDLAISHVYAALHAVVEERFEDARAEIDRARALGLPEERYAKLEPLTRRPSKVKAWLHEALAGAGAFVFVLAVWAVRVFRRLDDR